MSLAAPERNYVPEDLLSLPDNGKSYELVGGKLVEKHVGGFSDWVSGRILRLLGTFGEELGLGWALAETGYQCFSTEPRKVRKPDVSFILRGRLPGEQIPDGHIGIVPDLAVEVISPNDTAYELEVKVLEYFAVGVKLVWVVDPRTRTVYAFHGGRSVEHLQENDELTAPELFPEFHIKVADFFTPLIRK